MGRQHIANPLLDNYSDFDPVNLINPYSFGAAAPLLAIVSQSTSGRTTRNDYGPDTGFKFTVGSSNLTVSALGVWKISGNNQVQTINIRDSGGTIVATATFDMTTGTDGTYGYTTLGSPYVLTASAVYYIGATHSNYTDLWYDDSPIDCQTASADITVNGSYYWAGSTNLWRSGNYTYRFLNFKYTV